MSQIKQYDQNARTHNAKQIQQIARSIKNFGFNNPILLDDNNTIIAGHGRFMAAQSLKLKEVPTIKLSHLSEAEKKAYIIADNRLAEKAGWDNEMLKLELGTLADMNLDFDLTLTGFETPEIDLIIFDEVIDQDHSDPADSPLDEEKIQKRVSEGDLWQLGNHYLYCGNSLEKKSFKTLLGDKKAQMIFTDPPYNVKVDGHVGNKGKTKHNEFAFASSEMSADEFHNFLDTAIRNLKAFSKNGSLHYICMDWRHIYDLLKVGENIYDDLKNICIWNKQSAGMGSLYRSQHEFIALFKSGKNKHINNIELGKHGRYRTNVWDYPGVHASNHHRDQIRLHPTVKPVSMIADAILDSTNQKDIVLDCFGGSGSTLLAAERVGRKAYIIEYEPKYCDVTIARFEKITGEKAALIKGDTDV